MSKGRDFKSFFFKLALLSGLARTEVNFPSETSPRLRSTSARMEAEVK